MGKTAFRYLCALLAILFASCSKEDPLDKMEHIKMVGNDHPKQALAMLDSLEQEARRGSVYAQKKYDLLHIRLSDKANILPKSDAKIKELVEYFGKKGSDQEKQEVYYYAGSVYRDLQDCPRALEYFYKSTDFAIGHPDCDSIMLRNTYSNLNFLQYRVQNYKEALAMSKEELRISKELGTEDVVDHMHVGAAYKATGNAKEAVKEYDKAFHIADTTKDQSAYQESYIRLLMDYSGLGEIKKAQRCRPLIKEELNPYFSVLKDQALAHYYMACGKRDSAIIYSQRIIDNGKDQNNMYDAAKQLFRLYEEQGDVVNAHRYAVLYMQLSDTLDFGRRQEQAATLTNAYKYHMDQKKEMELRDEKEMYARTLFVSIFVFTLLGAGGAIVFIHRRNVHLRKMLELSERIEQMAHNEQELRKEMERKEVELRESKEDLALTKKDLVNTQAELDKANDKLTVHAATLQETEKMLAEKIKEGKMFLQLLHQSKLEESSEDVALRFRKAALGGEELTSDDWDQLYHAVDQAYPSFAEALLGKSGEVTKQQKQACYLLRFGMSKNQIQCLTHASRRHDLALGEEIRLGPGGGGTLAWRGGRGRHRRRMRSQDGQVTPLYCFSSSMSFKISTASFTEATCETTIDRFPFFSFRLQRRGW